MALQNNPQTDLGMHEFKQILLYKDANYGEIRTTECVSVYCVELDTPTISANKNPLTNPSEFRVYGREAVHPVKG